VCGYATPISIGASLTLIGVVSTSIVASRILIGVAPTSISHSDVRAQVSTVALVFTSFAPTDLPLSLRMQPRLSSPLGRWYVSPLRSRSTTRSGSLDDRHRCASTNTRTFAL
jgi:hypothetical protein